MFLTRASLSRITVSSGEHCCGSSVGRAAPSMSVTGNLIRNVHIGIGVPISIAETVPIAGNVISGANDGAIRAMDGPTPIGPDLADRFAAS